jgi:hypothetical protein
MGVDFFAFGGFGFELSRSRIFKSIKGDRETQTIMDLYFSFLKTKGFGKRSWERTSQHPFSLLLEFLAENTKQKKSLSQLKEVFCATKVHDPLIEVFLCGEEMFVFLGYSFWHFDGINDMETISTLPPKKRDQKVLNLLTGKARPISVAYSG